MAKRKTEAPGETTPATKKNRKTDDAGGTAPATKTKKRVKVLTTKKKLSSETQNFYDKNASESPLLRLPPEIRNRIWELLLANKDIHIPYSQQPGKVNHSICQNPSSTAQDVASIKQQLTNMSTETRSFLPSYDVLHAKCSHGFGKSDDVQERLPLHVLGVCRQIHQEAALLPYQRNTFVVECDASIMKFLGALLHGQAGAIENIALSPIYTTYVSTHSKAFLKLIERKLTGLRNLTGFVEVRDCVVVVGMWSRQRAWELKKNNLLQIPIPTLRSTSFGVYNIKYYPEYDGNPVLSAGEAIKWAKEIEDGLSGSSVPEE